MRKTQKYLKYKKRRFTKKRQQVTKKRKQFRKNKSRKVGGTFGELDHSGKPIKKSTMAGKYANIRKKKNKAIREVTNKDIQDALRRGDFKRALESAHIKLNKQRSFNNNKVVIPNSLKDYINEDHIDPAAAAYIKSHENATFNHFEQIDKLKRNAGLEYDRAMAKEGFGGDDEGRKQYVDETTKQKIINMNNEFKIKMKQAENNFKKKIWDQFESSRPPTS